MFAFHTFKGMSRLPFSPRPASIILSEIPPVPLLCICICVCYFDLICTEICAFDGFYEHSDNLGMESFHCFEAIMT